MNVFRLFVKLVKSNIAVIMIYMGIFLGIVLINTSQYEDSTKYNDIKPNIAIIDEDNSQVSKGLEAFLAKNAKIMPNDNLEDELYFGQVACVITIPLGFEEKLFTSDKINLEYEKSYSELDSGELIVNKVNDYINKVVNVYSSGIEDIEQIISIVDKAFDKQIEPQFIANNTNEKRKAKAFYIYLGYVLIAIIGSVISSIMLSLNENDIRRRNNVSPVSIVKYNRCLFICNLVFSFLFTGAVIILSMALYGKGLQGKTGVILMANALIYSTFCVSLGYLIGLVSKNKQISGAIINIVSLAPAFLCGIFVPQEYLSLPIGKVLPPYYYIRAIEVVTNNPDNYNEVILCGGIQLAFAALLFGICLYISNKQRTKEF